MIDFDGLTLNKFENFINDFLLIKRNKKYTNKNIRKYILNDLYFYFRKNINHYESNDYDIQIRCKDMYDLNSFDFNIYSKEQDKSINITFNKESIQLIPVKKKKYEISDKPIDIIEIIKYNRIVRTKYFNKLNLNITFNELISYSIDSNNLNEIVEENLDYIIWKCIND